VEQSVSNMDVGRCKNLECEKHKVDSCYRILSQASEYDFAKICNEGNEYMWFIKNNLIPNNNNNNESENTNEQV